jgi:hypothetical protein
MFKGVLRASVRRPHSSDLTVKLSITLYNEKILSTLALPMPSKTDAVRHLSSPAANTARTRKHNVMGSLGFARCF